jgi:ketosteroid isomerase-like protein
VGLLPWLWLDNHWPMFRTFTLWLLAPLLLAGCASISNQEPNKNSEIAKEQVHRVLDQIFDACEKKDLDRLDSYHLYGPQFTKFDSLSPGRLGAEAARQGEHAGLSAVNDLHMQAEDLDIEIFDGTAICAFLLDYSFKTATDTIQRKARATLVFAKDHGHWKIVHEHLSAPPASR